jgi:outer membrane protein assembly factor BamB
MICEEICTLLAIRRELSLMQERAVQAHLADCPRCAAIWLREERVMRQFRAIPMPPGRLPENTKIAIRRAMITSHRSSRRHMRRFVFAGVTLTLFVLVVLLQPRIRHYITQTVGAGSLAAPSPTPAFPTPLASSGTLYVASAIVGANASEVVGARLTAIDLATWQERYRVEGGDEATLSPDGTRLYVAGSPPGITDTDTLRAIDPQSGREIWRIQLKYRAAYPGQSNLVVSPDGRWLYLRSYDQTRGSGDAVTVPFWLQIIDTRTGSLLPTTIPLPNIGECGAPTLASPPVGIAIYVSCYNNRILAINTRTQQIESLLPEEVNGAILSPNIREMYAVNVTLDVFVLDSVQRTMLRKSTMRPKSSFLSSHDLVALSGNGTRLVAGQTIEGIPGTDTACDIRVFDTSTGDVIGRFRYERPLHSFIVDMAGTRLYAVIGAMKADMTIVEFDLPGGAVHTVQNRSQEEITRMFVGP